MIPNEFWIVLTQYDQPANSVTTSYCGPPKGPLVHEQYCHTEKQARDRAEKLRGQYGWTHIMKVVSEGGKQS